MAKSTVRLLHDDRATVQRPSSTGRHHHPFWQLDHCVAGNFTVTLPDGAHRLRSGQGVLLPPGLLHDFRYPRGARFVSWKFQWSGSGPEHAVILDLQPGWRGLAAAFAERPAATALPHLLAGAMQLAGAPDPATTSSGPVALVANLIAAHPERVWNVTSVAAALALSPGHLSTSFRTAHGLPLKQWLDAQRAAHAGRILAASDLSIADVARRCRFADQFTFSCFFRRVTGERPGAFRQRLGLH